MNNKVIIPILLLALASCDRTPVVMVSDSNGDSLKENMINANKVISQSEETQIDAYAARRNWNLQKLPNGARIFEYQAGNGSLIDFEDTVNVVYRLEAINGTVFYENQDESFVVGRNQTTTGLDYAVRKLRHGSRAHLILPSTLGYGVVGDGDRVPSRAVLIYDLTIL